MNKNGLTIDVIQSHMDKKIERFKGRKISELKEILGLYTNNKASFVQLSLRMLGITNNQFELYDGQVDAVLKTIRLTGLKTPAEAMSFMNVDFEEWLSAKSWNTSSLYTYFSNKVLVFFIFQQYPAGRRVEDDEMTFFGIKVWKMSEYDLNHGLKEVWEEVRGLLINNTLEITPITQRDGRIINKNNLPSIRFNGLGHLRPGGKNGEDTVLLPTGQPIVRQRFWLNSGYIKEILEM